MEHYLSLITKAVFVENILLAYFLGMCSFLAVSKKVDASIGLGFAVIFVLCSSNVVISLLREYIPARVRIVIMLSVIASLVSFVDEVLQAYMYNMSKQLSVFVGLIVTNCIIMGRAEAFAIKHGPSKAFLDGLGLSLIHI